MSFIKTCLKTELALKKFKIWFKIYKPAQNHWYIKRVSLLSKLLFPLTFLLPIPCNFILCVYHWKFSVDILILKKKKKEITEILKYQSGLRVSFIKETNINTPFVCNLIIKRVWKWGVFFRRLVSRHTCHKHRWTLGRLETVGPDSLSMVTSTQGADFPSGNF